MMTRIDLNCHLIIIIIIIVVVVKSQIIYHHRIYTLYSLAIPLIYKQTIHVNLSKSPLSVSLSLIPAYLENRPVCSRKPRCGVCCQASSEISATFRPRATSATQNWSRLTRIQQQQ